MSLEKRRETGENRKLKELEASSFRRLNFAPLQEVKTVKKPKIAEQEKIIEELTEVEKDVLEIAKIILKLKRYDADFDIEVASEAELQKFPIIEKLYAKCIAKLVYILEVLKKMLYYKKHYKNPIFKTYNDIRTI